MTVYNGQDYVSDALASVFNQSSDDFEVVVIENGSTDSTAEILRSIKDKRCRCIWNKENQGIAGALNQGLGIIDTPYVVRMDADDVAYPDRLRTQLAFMKANPEVGVLGTAISTLGSDDTYTCPETDSKIRVALLEGSAFAHPTVMIRTELLKRVQYDTGFPYAEDYNLWVDLSKETRFANLPIPLLHYRRHVGQVSSRNAAEQNLSRQRIIRKYLDSLFQVELGEPAMQAHFALVGIDTKLDMKILGSWMEALRAAGRESKAWQDGDLDAFFCAKLYDLVAKTRAKPDKKRPIRRFARAITKGLFR